MAYPEWVERERRPGTNISCTRGKYYLYEVTSVWNPEKKRAQKKTGKYLGRITEEGLIPPKPKKVEIAEGISTKEYGATSSSAIRCSVKETLSSMAWSFSSMMRFSSR